MVLTILNSHLLMVKKPFILSFIEKISILRNIKTQHKKMSMKNYLKNDELKGNENEGIFEYGNDFINCRIMHSK